MSISKERGKDRLSGHSFCRLFRIISLLEISYTSGIPVTFLICILMKQNVYPSINPS